MTEIEQELHFTDTDAAPTRSETHVSGARIDRNKLFVALGLVVAAIVTWSLLSPRNADDSPEPVGSDAAVPDADGSEASQLGETGADTTVLDELGESELEGDPEAGAEIYGRVEAAVPGSESEGVPVLTPSGELVGSDLVPAAREPLIPGSDLSLIVNNFSGEVEVIGLGTGDVSKHRLLSGELILQVDDRLIFQDQIGGFVLIVDAADLDGEVIRVDPPAEFAVAVAAWSTSDGFATVLSTNFAEDEVLAESTLNLETGALVETRIVDPALARDSLLSAYALSPNVFSPPTGGVYVREGDASYRKVLDGRLLLADDQFALVQNCDEDLACVRQWHDVTTWEALIRPMPEDAFEIGLLLGKGRVIVYLVPGAKSLAIFDVELGRELPIDSSLLGFGPAVSSDGGLLAFFDGDSGDVVIFDLETLERTRLELESARGALAFVDLTSGQ